MEKQFNNNSNTKFWKWTKGEPYERSRRLKHVEELENEEFTKEVETNAYQTALNHDENTWDILNQKGSLSSNSFSSSSKREELDTKIADRQLVQQRGYNPFLDNRYGEDRYVNDVIASDKFLKPVNTTLTTDFE